MDKIIVTCLLLLTAFLLSACAAHPGASATTADGPRLHTVFVISHGWHTGLVVPGEQVNRLLPELQRRFGRPLWYEIGWGDQDFYQARETTLGLGLQALFWSRGAALQVVAVREPVGSGFAASRKAAACLTEEELVALLRFIAASFRRDPAGTLIPLGPGLYGDSWFYAATGRFHPGNTCNRWTAQGLRSAGFDLSPWFRLTAGSVFSGLQGHDKTCPTVPAPAR